MDLPFFILFIVIVIFPSASSVYFNMPRFDPNVKNINYQGDAAPSVGAIELNSKYTYTCHVGWATYAESVPLWESDTGKLTDFTTKFSITIDAQGRSFFGSGLAFFLAPVAYQIPTNSAGGFLGLFNTSTAYSSSNQVVLVEFDSVNNPEWDPRDVDSHVGINNNSVASVAYTAWNASFHSGHTADVRISYNASTKNLSVSWSYQESSNPEENTSLFYIIDLVKVLPQWVTVGFSATTGQFTERNILELWEFNSTFSSTKGNVLPNPKRSNKMLYLLIILTVVPVAAIILYLRWPTKKKMDSEETQRLNSNGNAGSVAGLTARDLVFATNNFSDFTKLDEEGFGVVHRGYLTDFGIAVAVKRVSLRSEQEKEKCITELNIIRQLNHENLAQLIGWCQEDGQILLVYEVVPNGNLDLYLFGEKCFLTWAMRYKISFGLASALLYLHEKWEKYSIVHQDIRSSNILLDSNFNVKLGIFGLAWLRDHELGPPTTGLDAGTSGHLDPEDLSTGKASQESDVYSFGVIALEIATGRKSTDPIEGNSETGLVQWVWDLYGREKLLLGVDKRLDKYYDKQKVECLMKVGLWCAHPNSSSRPSMKQVIQVLNSEIEMPNLPKKMPFLLCEDYGPPQNSTLV